MLHGSNVTIALMYLDAGDGCYFVVSVVGCLSKLCRRSGREQQ